MIDHFKSFPDCSLLSDWIAKDPGKYEAATYRAANRESLHPRESLSIKALWAQVEVQSQFLSSESASQKHSIAFPNWNHFWELLFWITMNDLSWLGSSWFRIVIISGPPLGKKLLDGTALKSTFSGSLDSSPFESFTLEHLGTENLDIAGFTRNRLGILGTNALDQIRKRLANCASV